MSESSVVRLVARVLTSIRRDATLPVGCTTIEPDEDDVCSWFVKLHYPAADPQYVDVHLKFVAVNEPPYISVLQPRLTASFLHDGALCSWDLMSTSWQLSKECVVMLLCSLHVTLDQANGVTVDAASPVYTAEERRKGQEWIEKAHSAEFSALHSALDASAGEHYKLALPVLTEIRSSRELAAHLSELFTSHEAVQVTVDDNLNDIGLQTVVVRSSSSLMLPSLNLCVLGVSLPLRFDTECVVVPASSSVSLQNVTLLLGDDESPIQVFGRLGLTNCTVRIASIAAKGHAHLTIQNCTVESCSESMPLLSAEHTSLLTLRNSFLSSDFATEQAVLSARNQATVSVSDCIVYAPEAKIGLQAVLECTLLIQSTSVDAALLGIQAFGAHVVCEGSTFRGCGINGDLRSSLQLTDCTIDMTPVNDTEFSHSSGRGKGVACSDASRLQMTRCQVIGTEEVGCFVSHSVATLETCVLGGGGKGLVITSGAKVTATSLTTVALKVGVIVDHSTLRLRDSEVRRWTQCGVYVVGEASSIDAADVRVTFHSPEEDGDDDEAYPASNAKGVVVDQGEEGGDSRCCFTRVAVQGSMCGFTMRNTSKGILEECSVVDCCFGLEGDGRRTFVTLTSCRLLCSRSGLCLSNEATCTASKLCIMPNHNDDDAQEDQQGKKFIGFGAQLRTGARLALRDSDIKDVLAVGIRVDGKATCDVERVRITACAYDDSDGDDNGPVGMGLSQSGTCAFRSVSFFGFHIGASIHQSSSANISQCSLNSCSVGFLVFGHASGCLLDSCTVECRYTGLRVEAEATCTATQLSVQPWAVGSGFLATGVEVLQGGIVTLSDSTILNAFRGIYGSSQSVMDVINVCVQWSNREPGVASPHKDHRGVFLEGSASCALRRTSITGYCYGVWAADAPRTTMSQSSSIACCIVCFTVTGPESSVELTEGCTLECHDTAVVIEHHAKFTAKQKITIRGVQQALPAVGRAPLTFGVLVMEASRVELEDLHISDVDTYGMFVAGSSQVRAEDIQISAAQSNTKAIGVYVTCAEGTESSPSSSPPRPNDEEAVLLRRVTVEGCRAAGAVVRCVPANVQLEQWSVSRAKVGVLVCGATSRTVLTDTHLTECSDTGLAVAGGATCIATGLTVRPAEPAGLASWCGVQVHDGATLELTPTTDDDPQSRSSIGRLWAHLFGNVKGLNRMFAAQRSAS